VQNSVKETRLKTVDADGSNQKLLLTTRGDRRMFPVFRAGPVAWSPDGETIACAVQESDDTGSFSRILLVDANDGSERYLSERRWDFVENIVWKDTEHLALINIDPKSRLNRIWQISRRTGQTRQLTDDLSGYRWLAASSNGNLLTVQKNVFSSLMVADYAENTRTLQPKQIYSESGVIENIAWSREEKIFYNSWTSGKNEIWQINPDGTAPRQLTADSDLIHSFTVSPTDNTLVFSTLKNGRISLSAADSNGQNVRALTDGAYDFSPSFAPDGKSVVFQRGSTMATLWRAFVKGNSAPAQLTGYFASHPSVSPDGQLIAYHFMDYGGKNPHWKLGLIDSENRRLLNKLEFPVPITERNTIWHPKRGLLTMTFSNGETVGILLLSAADGSFQTIDNIAAGKISSFGWSPGGNRFAFSQNFETNDLVSLGAF
jgi:Tol biopolymer transport system component